MEPVIFVTFVAIQLGCKQLEKLAANGKFAVFLQHLSQNHYVVWFFHPAVLHGAQEYLVHFFVYSGYVLHAH